MATHRRIGIDSWSRVMLHSRAIIRKGVKQMSRGSISGYRLTAPDAAIVKGMLLRGDRGNDIASWFGVNPARIADVKDGKTFASVAVAPSHQLPQSGPPGIKGRRLRDSVRTALKHLQSGDAKAATEVLQEGAKRYDANEA